MAPAPPNQHLKGLVKRVYEATKPMLYRLDVDTVEDLLLNAGFAEVTYKTTDAYAGQAMIVCARKQNNLETQ